MRPRNVYPRNLYPRRVSPRNVLLVVLCWLVAIPVAVAIPSTASAQPTANFDQTLDALLTPEFGLALSGPVSAAAPRGASRFGGVRSAQINVPSVQVNVEAGPEQTTIACDADGDGVAGAFWRTDQSDGDDNWERIYRENRTTDGLLEVGFDPLTITEPGYATNIWVCQEGGEWWVNKRTPVDTIVLAYDSLASYEAAKQDAQNELLDNLFVPGWQIWPGHNSRQIVGLPSWLYVTDEAWEYEPTATSENGDVSVTAIARPVGSAWHFEDLSDVIICDNRGDEWTAGNIEPPRCGREWEHTYQELELEVGLLYEFQWTSSLAGPSSIEAAFADDAYDGALEDWRVYANGGRPFQGLGEATGPLNDGVDLRVGEVQAYGSTVGARVQAPPPDSPPIEGRLYSKCGGWLGTFTCIAGAVVNAVDAVASFIIPGYEQIKTFLAGCVEGLGVVANQFKDAVLQFIETASNPFKAAGEAWQTIKEMAGGLASDPVGFIAEIGSAALREELLLDQREDWGNVQWAGALVCKFAVNYFTGRAAGAILGKILEFINKKTTRPDADIPDDNGPGDGNPGDGNPGDGNPGDGDGGRPDDDPDRDGPTCPASSFPAGTPVLMADGTHTPIELIRPGDFVISYNHGTSVWEPKLVVDQWSHPDRGPPATATLPDGSTITATDDHLFWVTSSETWTELQHVQPGDEFLTPEGPVTVDTITVGPAHPWTVWELTVTDNHNFTVSTSTTDLLVHNHGHTIDDAPPYNSPEFKKWVESLSPDQKSAINSSILPSDGTIPEWDDPKFGEWFDQLSPKQAEFIQQQDRRMQPRRHFDDRLRGDGALHEWITVRTAARALHLGITADMIHGLTTPTAELWVTDPDTGIRRNHQDSLTRFHNLLRAAMAESVSIEDYLKKVEKIASDWKVGGQSGPDDRFTRLTAEFRTRFEAQIKQSEDRKSRVADDDARARDYRPGCP